MSIEDYPRIGQVRCLHPKCPTTGKLYLAYSLTMYLHKDGIVRDTASTDDYGETTYGGYFDNKDQIIAAVRLMKEKEGLK